ncbi:phosphonate transport system substrate-binding protein [Sulfuritortus calidifontis]|uniref:Phosphonate transport system substrate-binding protein n=1 Tax=Sulfuritortus calidifontis TaxID=1914471 RepID=A0A4R3JU00_9PROT|nr:phosphate/phosphite/phosphonate ABC transporter substrate-binding protein [Sulfuritortus calidifontis]TCS71056.1 phosphonate transport system substrate-binding protein [Sulfuritortus calidifontis]
MKKSMSCLFALCLAVASAAARAEEAEPLRFGVVNQRSVALTAEAWNPILTYVGHKIGRRLVLKLGKTAPETTAMTERGEHDLAYSNHMFSPERDKLGYRAILRIAGEPIRGLIVVLEDSPIRTLKQLQGHTVASPSRDAPIAYQVPMDHLKRSGIDVRVAFAGNQEGAMAQLQFGKAAAATVNQKILDSYAAREGLRYRVLWASPPYPDIPIVAHRSLPPKLVAAIREAFIGMDEDPEGRKALRACADALSLRQPWSFVQADDRDYDVYRRFYEKSLVKD